MPMKLMISEYPRVPSKQQVLNKRNVINTVRHIDHVLPLLAGSSVDPPLGMALSD